MRRRGSGLLLPGLVLTALAVAGVVILLAVGSPVVPRRLPGFPVNAQDERRSVHVAPSTRPPSAAPTWSPTPEPTPTVAPTTTGPDVPRGSATVRPPTTTPTAPRTTAPTTRPPTTTPVTPKCAAGSKTLTAGADTYVDQASPTQSFGGASNLLVASRDKDRNRRALVSFALPSIPAGCTLRSATLTLTAKEVTGRRLLVNRAGRSWTESVTWNTAPAPSGASVAATVSATTVSWSVTSLVAAMTSGANYGFVVRDASENARGAGEQTNFNSRTARSAPTLSLRWS